MRNRYWRSLLAAAIVVAGCTNDPERAGDSKPKQAFKDCADCPEMVVIPAGSFLMGSPETEWGRQADEGPQHHVTIPKDFAVSKFEITVAQYRVFTEATGKGGQDWVIVARPDVPDDQYPVYWISWHDAQDYMRWLSSHTGQHYRLLSEAEWEYAARAGNSNTDAWEPRETQVRGVQPGQWWYQDTVPVGGFRPNDFGLYDMTDNIPEWIEDCYAPSYISAPSDASAVVGDCKQRVVRGAYNFSRPELARIANRDWNYAVNRATGNPTGLRIARDFP
jgi:formylglycine-generating enzyme required for sulfatase activity